MKFKMMYDALTKSKLLKEAYDEVGKMNRNCRHLFATSVDCLVNDKDELAKEISDEDMIINRGEIEVRKNLLNYLAINTAPDVGTALILSSVVVDYERIGDYCKGIAWLGLLYPTTLEEDEFMGIVDSMKTVIREQFDFTYNAFKDSDAIKAKKVLSTYNGLKLLHEGLIKMLNDDETIEKNKAIVLACLSIYLRRISAHLKNISSSVIEPYPYLGFDPEEKQEMKLPKKKKKKRKRKNRGKKQKQAQGQ